MGSWPLVVCCAVMRVHLQKARVIEEIALWHWPGVYHQHWSRRPEVQFVRQCPLTLTRGMQDLGLAVFRS